MSKSYCISILNKSILHYTCRCWTWCRCGSSRCCHESEIIIISVKRSARLLLYPKLILDISVDILILLVFYFRIFPNLNRCFFKFQATKTVDTFAVFLCICNVTLLLWSPNNNFLCPSKNNGYRSIC